MFSTTEKVHTNFYLPYHMFYIMRRMALDKRTTFTGLITKAVSEYIERHDDTTKNDSNN